MGPCHVMRLMPHFLTRLFVTAVVSHEHRQDHIVQNSARQLSLRGVVVARGDGNYQLSFGYDDQSLMAVAWPAANRHDADPASEPKYHWYP